MGTPEHKYTVTKLGTSNHTLIEGNDKQNLGDSLSLIMQDEGVMQRQHTDKLAKMFVRKFKRARIEGIYLTTIDTNQPD